MVGICTQECNGDEHCDGDKKCCSNGCGRVCVDAEPLIKPGHCPAVQQGKIGACVQYCSTDESCAAFQKCCSNGCGTICINPTPVVKEGLCPAVYPDQAGTCSMECYDDAHCEGSKKCCGNGCGRVCADPGHTCRYGNLDYRELSSRIDECNTCVCKRNGWSCTENECTLPCEYSNKQTKHLERLELDCVSCICYNSVWKCESSKCSKKYNINFAFDADYSIVRGNEDDFTVKLIQSLERYFGIKNIISDLTVREGSILVSYNLIAMNANEDLNSIAIEMENAFTKGLYNMTYGGDVLIVKADTFTRQKLQGNQPEKSFNYIGIGVGCVLVGLVLIIGLATAIRKRKFRKSKKYTMNEVLCDPAQDNGHATGINNGSFEEY
ncbi:uncharacterized protein LOC102803789 [Saccoglossus kowalevskii]